MLSDCSFRFIKVRSIHKIGSQIIKSLGAIKPKWRKYNSQNLVCLPLPKGDLPFHDYLCVDTCTGGLLDLSVSSAQ